MLFLKYRGILCSEPADLVCHVGDSPHYSVTFGFGPRPNDGFVGGKGGFHLTP